MTVAPTTGPGHGRCDRARAHRARRRPDHRGGRRRHHQRSRRGDDPLASAAGDSARRHGQRAGDGDEARAEISSARRSGLRELQPRRISVGHVTCDGGRVAALPADGGDRAGRAHRVPRERRAEERGPANSPTGWRAGACWGGGWPSSRSRSTAQKQRCSFALVSKVRNYGGDFEIARSVTPARRPVRGGAVRRATPPSAT